MNVSARLNNERGVALPMAIMTLLLLTTLMLAFAVLSQTEPVIAANQLRVAQARAMAESGFERAVWALTNSTDALQGLASPLPTTTVGAEVVAVAPFDGATLLSGDSVTTGGFVVKVRNDQSATADINVREITAVGWTPTNDNTDKRPKAHRTIFARVSVLPPLGLMAPCALCVRGALNIQNNASVNGTNTGTNASQCGSNNKNATFTRDATTAGGSVTLTGGGSAPAVAQNQPSSVFDSFTLTSSNMNTLKELAKKNGTYFGPGYANGGTTPDYTTPWTCSIAFSSSRTVGNGAVFVDTCDGQNLTSSSSPTNIATVTITDGAFTGLPPLPGYPPTAGAFAGWLVVNGTLTINGPMTMNGVVYAANDLTYNGTGSGGINGLAISQNLFDASASTIDTNSTGSSAVNFNCNNVVSLPGLPSSNFRLVQGSYREIAD